MRRRDSPKLAPPSTCFSSYEWSIKNHVYKFEGFFLSPYRIKLRSLAKQITNIYDISCDLNMRMLVISSIYPSNIGCMFANYPRPYIFMHRNTCQAGFSVVAHFFIFGPHDVRLKIKIRPSFIVFFPSVLRALEQKRGGKTRKTVKKGKEKERLIYTVGAES